MKTTSKGQVTIPQGIRDRFGLLPGIEIQSVTRDGEVLIVPKSSGDGFDEWVQEFAGSGNSGLSTDEVMQITRGED